MGDFKHYSVLLSETIAGLAIKANGTYVDCTAGGGGHSLAIAEQLGAHGKLIAIDQDSAALSACQKRLASYLDRVTLVKDNFQNIASILDGEKIDGACIDLGVSTYQLTEPTRGFSYLTDAPLDMRMDTDAPLTAYDIVNTYSHGELAKILFEYGEEKFAGKIATAIVNTREIKPIETTLELVDCIEKAIPARPKNGHPAKRTFQAIRIAVNRELEIIAPTLRALVDALKPGGRLAVITFHSLEDRIVKQTFAELAKGCICPPNFPVCVCGHAPEVLQITRKPILPTEAECTENTPSHSAKLRVVEKL